MHYEFGKNWGSFIKDPFELIIDDVDDDRRVKSGNLILQHDHDGRDIDLDHAENVISGLMKIWPNHVKFFTIIEDEPWEI